MDEGGTALAGRSGAPDASATAAFHRSIPAFADFDTIADPRHFFPLPDDWTVGLADVVSSTAAIGAGRYKAVNTAGASVISAVSNALRTLDFPFLFAGDGATFAVAPQEADGAARALAATVHWVGRQLGLDLRGGIVTVGEIRQQGFDVRVARFAASADAVYAMFAGGGLGWAEQRLKAGLLAQPTAPPDAQPDLTGLSCRFQDIRSKHGVILSILVRPVGDAAAPPFQRVMAEVLAIAGRGPDAGRPIPVFNPRHGVSPRAIALNARLSRRAEQTHLRSLLQSAAASLFVSVLLATGLRVGRFSARRYIAQVIANTDFRKYDDRLMMTVDCSAATADEVERCLAAAERDGIVRYGLHRQGSATVTCVVPAASQASHVHFIDGAAGGYAMAARSLKAN